MSSKEGLKKVLFILLIIGFLGIGLITFINNKEEKKVAYIPVKEDLISKQASVDEKIKEVIEADKYRFDTPYILNNPYEISPLTSLIIFETEKEESVKVYLNDEKYLDSKKTSEHVLAITGLIANKENKIEISTTEGNYSYTTTPTLKGLPKMEVKTSNKGNYYLTSSFDSAFNYAIYDGTGNLVWYLDLKSLGMLEELTDDTFIVSVEENNNGISAGLYIIDYLGKIVKRIDSKYAYHHDLEVIDDKTVIMLGSKDNDNSLVYKMDIMTGSIVDELSVLSLLKEIDAEYDEDLIINSLDYKKDTGELLVSVSNQDMVLNIDYQNREIKWIYADPDNLSDNFSDYILRVNGNFGYPKGPSEVIFMRNGISLYDRGLSSKDKIKNIKDNDVEARALMLIVDTNYNSIRLYGSITDEDKYSYQDGGFVTYLESDLVTYSYLFKDDAINKNINIKDYEGNIYSKIVEYNNFGDEMFVSSMDVGLYRTKIVSLPKFNSYNMKEYTYISNYEKVSSSLDDIKSGKAYRESLQMYDNSFDISLKDTNYKKVSLILRNGEETITIPYLGQRTYFDIEDGKYDVFINIDDIYYDLEKKIKFE